MSLPLNCLCMFLASPLSDSPFLPQPHPDPSFCQVCLQMPQSRNLPERGESSFHSSSILRGVHQGEADRPTAPQGSGPGWEVIYSQKVWKGITGDTARHLATLRKCSSCLRKKNSTRDSNVTLEPKSYGDSFSSHWKYSGGYGGLVGVGEDENSVPHPTDL